jgi:hypothetical protein
VIHIGLNSKLADAAKNMMPLSSSKKDSLHGQLTLLDNESVLLGVHRYLAAQSLGSITTKDFCWGVNRVVVPAVGYVGKEATISRCTARN